VRPPGYSVRKFGFTVPVFRVHRRSIRQRKASSMISSPSSYQPLKKRWHVLSRYMERHSTGHIGIRTTRLHASTSSGTGMRGKSLQHDLLKAAEPETVRIGQSLATRSFSYGRPKPGTMASLWMGRRLRPHWNGWSRLPLHCHTGNQIGWFETRHENNSRAAKVGTGETYLRHALG
jgi:hypothetical protein